MFTRFAGLSSALVLMISSSLSGQVRTVAGRVTDSMTGRPVTSGVVLVRGERIRDELRPDGVFVLHLSDGEHTLWVRADGYRTREIVISPHQTELFVDIEPTAVHLANVVASTGDMHGFDAASTTILTGAQLGNINDGNILGGLQGKVAGADVQSNSGVPGGDFQLTLRGAKTIVGSTSPLFVVDGTYVSNASIATGATSIMGGQEALPSRIADLNPSDIESIQILKGAAAATLYGSKGSNGVVIITTKRGGRR